MEHAFLQRLNTEDKARASLPSHYKRCDTVRIVMAFICSSGAPLLDSPECPSINPASSLVRKEECWSEISLVMITNAVAQHLVKQRNLFYPHPIWYYPTLVCNNTFLEVLVKRDNFANKHRDRGTWENRQAQKPTVNETLETTIFLLFKRNKEPHVCQE